MSEQSIASARASVMICDGVNERWVPSGTSSGLSKVHIYQHTVQQTFRVVGRKIHDHEVVINCAILKGLKYNQATPTFHQWRDNKQVYGLNFSSKEDADLFARAMYHSLEMLSNLVRQQQPLLIHLNSCQVLPSGAMPPTKHNLQNSQNVQLQQQQQQQQPPQIAQVPPNNCQHPMQPDSIKDNGYRSITREDASIIKERILNSMANLDNSISSTNSSIISPQIQTPPVPAMSASLSTSSCNSTSSATLNLVNGTHHQRNNSVPPPPAPPMPSQNVNTAPPPPPPPPNPNHSLSRSQSSDANTILQHLDGADSNNNNSNPLPSANSLAAQLQSAKLKRHQNNSNHTVNGFGVQGSNSNARPMQPPNENSGSSTSSAGSNYGTLGKVNGNNVSNSTNTGANGSMASMMDEMAKTLARRRAAVEKTTPDKHDEDENKRAMWEKTNTLPSSGSKFLSDSPKSARKRFGSASEETILKVNGLAEVGGTLALSSSEMDAFKSEMLRDIKRELASLDLEALKVTILKEFRKELNNAKNEIIDAFKCELSRR